MSLSESSALEFAGAMLSRHDIADCSSPDLLEVTGIRQSGVATASGLNQLSTVNKIPIPPEIMEHFKHIKCRSMMGLFPAIGRAWLTIDFEIYIWTYEQFRDVVYFGGLSHLIESVGLVVPKPGVFIADIKYLLALTTPVEIAILGVTFGDSNASPNRSISNTTEKMQLLNKPIFVLNTDNVAITCIEGTADGRIFLGGRDGCLYEISYQAESNWFGKRCKKVNHSQGLMSRLVPGIFKVFSENDSISKLTMDNSRCLLYALTEKGAIEVWDIGTDANSVKRIARVSQNDIVFSAGNILRTIEPSVNKPVTALCSLSQKDSPKFHLIAITQTGVRFYFSTVPVLYRMQQQQQQQQFAPGQPGLVPHELSQRPQGLYLLHVRLPPGYTPNTTGKPKQVHSAFYSQGSLLMISTPQPNQDLLWLLSSEPFPSRQNLVESFTTMTMDGQVWAIAEVKPKETPLRAAQVNRKVVLLTNQGVHIVSLLNSVEHQPGSSIQQNVMQQSHEGLFEQRLAALEGGEQRHGSIEERLAALESRNQRLEERLTALESGGSRKRARSPSPSTSRATTSRASYRYEFRDMETMMEMVQNLEWNEASMGITRARFEELKRSNYADFLKSAIHELFRPRQLETLNLGRNSRSGSPMSTAIWDQLNRLAAAYFVAHPELTPVTLTKLSKDYSQILSNFKIAR